MTFNRTVSDCFADWWEGTIDLERVNFDPASRTATLEVQFADYDRESESSRSVLSRSYESPVVNDRVEFDNVTSVDVAVDPGEVEFFINDLLDDGERIRIHGSQGTIDIHTPSTSCRITRRDTDKISLRRVYLGGLFNLIGERTE